jgi:single-strand DNA-binding protein
MRNLNRVTLIGQLTADPETKKIQNGKSITTFALATNYSWKNQAGEWQTGVDYHRLVAWDQVADRISAEFKKGHRVFIEGKLRTHAWETEEGTKASRTEIVVHSVLPMTSVEARRATEEIAEPAAAEEEVVTTTTVALP